MILDLFQLTWSSFTSKKLRSWLTIIGVIIGIAAIVSLFTLSQGLQNSVTEQFKKLGISSIRVVPGSLRGPPGGANRLSFDFKDDIESVNSVEYVDSIIIGNVKIEYNKETLYLRAQSFDVDIGEKGFADTDINPAEGRLFQKGDKNVVLLGWGVAKDAFDKEIFAKNTVVIDGKKMKVVGILEKTGGEIDNTITMPLETAQEVFNVYDAVNVFLVKIKDGVNVEESASQIERRLERVLDESEFTVFTPEQLLSQINDILGIIQVVLVAIAAVSLVVGGIGIMNSMFTSVLERTKEIGVMKAIGAKNGNVLLIFLIEAGVIGLVGGVIGAVIGSLLAKVIGVIASSYVTLVIIIDYRVIIFALFFAFIVGVISGMIPAIRAAKLQPVDALRYE